MSKLLNEPICIEAGNLHYKTIVGYNYTDIWLGDIEYIINRAYLLGKAQGMK